MDLQKRKGILDGDVNAEDFFDKMIKELDDEIGKTGKEFESIQKAVMDLVDEMKPKLYFAKTDDKAIIPSKRDEDGAYDFYPLIEPRETMEGLVYEQYLEKGKVSMIGTGIASSFPSDYLLSLKSERSSVGKHGISVLAGTIDSGYRNEIKILVIPLEKDILISSMVEDVEKHEDLTVIPYSFAIAQGAMLHIPSLETEEITYKSLLNMDSQRGVEGFGSTNKK